MGQSSDSIVDIILLLFTLEIIATIGFILFIYGLKIYKWLTRDDKEKIREDVEKVMLFRIEDRTLMSKIDIKILKKDILVTLKATDHFDDKHNTLSYWKFVRAQIVSDVFANLAIKYAKSKHLLKRYTSTKLFMYSYNESDALIVTSLIKDTAIFISVSASRVGFKFSSEALINVSIDVFYHFRRLQRSVLSSIAAGSPDSSRNIVIERLFRENDPYVRAFCYFLMMQFPIEEKMDDKFTRFIKTFTTQILPPFHIVQHLAEAIPRDLHSNVLDLQIAALKYAGHNPAYFNFVPHALDSPVWQLRAAAAKIVGEEHDEESADKLGELLRDKEWWVRIRSAQALVRLGPKGIRILKSQAYEQDKYAYEAAVQALLDMHEAES